MNILECVGLYEAETGEKMRDKAVQVITRLNKIGKAFEAKGREDIACGQPAVTDGFFQAWGAKAFPTDSEMGQLAGELMQDCYMDGYTAITKTE